MPPVAKEMLSSIKSEKERQFEIMQLRSKRNVNQSQDVTDLSSIFSNGKRKTSYKRAGSKEYVMDKSTINQSYRELSEKFDQKKAITMRKLAQNLQMPYTGNDGSMIVNENGQLVRAEGYSKKVRRNDPIKKLFTTN